MRTKRIAFCVLVLLFTATVIGLKFKDNLIRSFISLNKESLQTYAQEQLVGKDTIGHYGLWKTTCYPDAGMVEFLTSGAGLVPDSTYKGFYYSADDTHKPYAASEAVTLSQTDENTVSWTDGTDNHGTSVRITKNWFWFEASF